MIPEELKVYLKHSDQKGIELSEDNLLRWYKIHKRQESLAIGVNEFIGELFSTYKENQGYKLVQIQDEKSMKFEGKFLHHCLLSGKGSLLYKNSQIYSVRSIISNLPLLTIEVKDNLVRQIKGLYNEVSQDHLDLAWESILLLDKKGLLSEKIVSNTSDLEKMGLFSLSKKRIKFLNNNFANFDIITHQNKDYYVFKIDKLKIKNVKELAYKIDFLDLNMDLSKKESSNFLNKFIDKFFGFLDEIDYLELTKLVSFKNKEKMLFCSMIRHRKSLTNKLIKDGVCFLEPNVKLNNFFSRMVSFNSIRVVKKSNLLNCIDTNLIVQSLTVVFNDILFFRDIESRENKLLFLLKFFEKSGYKYSGIELKNLNLKRLLNLNQGKEIFKKIKNATDGGPHSLIECNELIIKYIISYNDIKNIDFLIDTCFDSDSLRSMLFRYKLLKEGKHLQEVDKFLKFVFSNASSKSFDKVTYDLNFFYKLKIKFYGILYYNPVNYSKSIKEEFYFYGND